MFIYSTLSSDVNFNCFNTNSLEKGRVPIIDKKICIKGGANVANKYSEFPKVIETKISTSDFEIVKEHKTFKKMAAGGYITHSNKRRLDFSDPKTAENIIKSMGKKDKAATLCVEDLESMGSKVKEVNMDDYGYHNV